MGNKTKVTGMKAYLNKWAKDFKKDLFDEQSASFVEYAKNKIQEIGDYIISNAESENHMDRTGHLLNSLCWGVSYDGKLLKSGFYRNAVLHKRRAKGWQGNKRVYTNESNLHEWADPSVSAMFPVVGRQLAKDYLQSYGNNGSRGWRVFFAILAPYWGYWEKGFRFKMNPNVDSSPHGFMQFAVMTHFYDEVRRDLKPARTRFRVSVPKYNISKLEERAMR